MYLCQIELMRCPDFDVDTPRNLLNFNKSLTRLGIMMSVFNVIWPGHMTRCKYQAGTVQVLCMVPWMLKEVAPVPCCLAKIGVSSFMVSNLNNLGQVD